MGIRQHEPVQHDVAILGGGAAGLACALFAARSIGVKPILIEHTSLLGGTTALSTGSVWIPGTEAGRDVNPVRHS